MAVKTYNHDLNVLNRVYVNALLPVSANELTSKQYVDSLVTAIGQWVGNFDASSGALPTTGSGNTGNANAIDKGDHWTISVSGVLPAPIGQVRAGDVLWSKVANASTSADFFVVEGNRDLATQTIAGITQYAPDADYASQVLALANTVNSITPNFLANYIISLGLTPITASNGLTKTLNNITMGGALTQATQIDSVNTYWRVVRNAANTGAKISIEDVGVAYRAELAGVDTGGLGARIYVEDGGRDAVIRHTATGQSLELATDSANNRFLLTAGASSAGLQGAIYYGANYTANSYVQKQYVDDAINNASYATTITSTPGTPIVVTHGLATLDVIVQAYDTATGEDISVQVIRTGINTISIDTNVAQTLRILVSKVV